MDNPDVLLSPRSSAAASLKSKLPDIDTSQKDTFEILPKNTEENQPNYVTIKAANSEEVESLNVNLSEARKKFESFSGTVTEDFRDLRRRKKAAVGFIQGQTDFEMVDATQKPPETPMQKFHRLQSEMKGFLEELANLKSGKSEETATPAYQDMFDEISLLQNQLHQLKTDESMGYRSLVDPDHRLQKSTEAQQILSNKLIREVSNFSKKGEEPSSNNVTYELYYAPDQAKAAQQTKIVEMEKRLYALECALGLNNDDLVVGASNAKDLIQTVQELREKLNLLTGTSKSDFNLEQLERKLYTVSQQMDTLQKKTQNPPKEANEQRLGQLFEIMTRWDSVAKTLPTVVSRLQFLKTVHESASTFATSVEQLEHRQTEITKMVKANEGLLSTVKTNFAQNLSTIQSNFEQLETRLQKFTSSGAPVQNNNTLETF